MAKYRKKPVVIEAIQWFKNGDHPQDNCRMIDMENGVDKPSERERSFDTFDVHMFLVIGLANTVGKSCTFMVGLTPSKPGIMFARVIGLLQE